MHQKIQCQIFQEMKEDKTPEMKRALTTRRFSEITQKKNALLFRHKLEKRRKRRNHLCRAIRPIRVENHQIPTIQPIPPSFHHQEAIREESRGFSTEIDECDQIIRINHFRAIRIEMQEMNKIDKIN